MIEFLQHHGIETLFGILIALQYKVFLTPIEFERRMGSLYKYMAETYVSDKTYRQSHKEIQDELHIIRRELGEVRNMLLQDRQKGIYE